MADRAIGVINTGCSENHAQDEQVIRDLAAARSYRFAGILTIGENTYMPTTLIVHTAASKGATVIVAPSLEHFGIAVQAVALACMLATPTITVPCTAGRGH